MFSPFRTFSQAIFEFSVPVSVDWTTRSYGMATEITRSDTVGLFFMGIYGILWDRVFRAGFPSNLQEMKDLIEMHCLIPDEEMFTRVRESFEERLLLCMHEDGKQFEYLL